MSQPDTSKRKTDAIVDGLIANVLGDAVNLLEEEFRIEIVRAILAQEQFCIPWEVDTDHWWTHHPDWVVSKENDTHYCFSHMAEPEKADFFKKLYANQFQSDCSTVWTKQMWSSGWGADFGNVVDALAGGVEHGRPVQMYYKDGWHYAATKQFDKPVCPTADMYCFFLPMTRCPPDTENVYNVAFRQTWSPQLFGRPWIWYMEYATRPQIWLRREVYNYAKNAVPPLTSLVVQQQRGGSCASLHVRRADVILHPGTVREYHKIKDYIQGAKETLGRSVPKDILLLTDDQDAIDEAKRDFPDYNWMYMNRTRFKGPSGGFENQLPSGDPRLEMIVLLSTFRLIQNCNLLINAQSSLADYMWGILLEHFGANATRADLKEWMKNNH